MAVVREERSGVAVLRMEHGKVNALDTEFLSDLIAAFDDAGRSAAPAIVLTGRGTVFSAGVDLVRLLDGGREYLEAFLPALTTAFHRLFMLPKPVVAAVNGHAIAGGHILMAACDYRVMAGGTGTVGVPELQVGVPFPAMAMEVLRHVTRPDVLQELICLGRTYRTGDALARGLVHELVEPEVLLDRALERALEMAAIPERSFRIAKHQLRAPALANARQLTADLDSEVAEVWAAPEIIAAVRAYLAKTLGKKK
jgi:enoyl-CoA hydratase